MKMQGHNGAGYGEGLTPSGFGPYYYDYPFNLAFSCYPWLRAARLVLHFVRPFRGQ